MRLRFSVFAAATAAAALAFAPAAAEEIVRDPNLIAAMEIQGVTLATPIEEAYDHLVSLGYTADGINSYEDWTVGGLDMVRGSYADPEGESWFSLGRAHGHLVHIAETFNRPRNHFDTDAELDAVQSHFGVAADDPNCRVNDAKTGTCRIADALVDANFVYGITAFPALIQRYASRNHELKDSLQ